MRALDPDDRLTITVNDREIEVHAGLTIMQALTVEGIDIPSLCHDVRLKQIGRAHV